MLYFHLQFERLRRTRPKPSDPRSPDLMMVYDSPTTSGSKSACPQVFQHQSAVNTAVNTTNTASVNTASVNTDDGGSADSDGVPVITNRGKYYKNVRSEWASLVATPATARFQVRPLSLVVHTACMHILTFCYLYLNLSHTYIKGRSGLHALTGRFPLAVVRRVLLT